MQIKVKYHAPITPIQFIGNKSDWVDLRTAEDTFIRAGECERLNLGVSMELPKGYEAVIVPRSPTFTMRGVLQADGMAVIDESFCGDNDIWSFQAYATRDVIIPWNTRICQFRIQKKMPRVLFESVETLGNTDRGGYGSTGVN